MFSADLEWTFICLVFICLFLFGAIFLNPLYQVITDWMLTSVFFSGSRLLSGHFEQWGCVCIWRGSALLCWDSEISLRKQCNPQTPAGQELHWCGSETHPEALHGGRHQLHYSRTHPCTGVSDLMLLRRVGWRFRIRIFDTFFEYIIRCFFLNQ